MTEPNTALMLTDYERPILSWLDSDGPMRLMEVVAMVNPPPRARHAVLLGVPLTNEWRQRTGAVYEAVAMLEHQGVVECVRRRWLRMSCVYRITETGRMTLAVMNGARKREAER